MARIDVYTAGCPLCAAAVEMAEDAAGDRHEVTVHDLSAEAGAVDEARTLGVVSVPTLAVDGELLGCCRSTGPSRAELDAALS